MLKVDILNCMGFGIGLLAILAVFTHAGTHSCVRHAGVRDRAGFAAGVAGRLGQLAAAAARLPRSELQLLCIFPVGRVHCLRPEFRVLSAELKQEQLTQAMQWIALAGVAIAFGANLLRKLHTTLYAKSEFWLNGPALLFIKLGVLLIGVAFCYVWMMQPIGAGLELGSSTGNYLFTRLLGAYRAGLWALARLDESESECAANYRRGRRNHSAMIGLSYAIPLGRWKAGAVSCAFRHRRAAPRLRRLPSYDNPYRPVALGIGFETHRHAGVGAELPFHLGLRIHHKDVPPFVPEPCASPSLRRESSATNPEKYWDLARARRRADYIRRCAAERASVSEENSTRLSSDPRTPKHNRYSAPRGQRRIKFA